MKTKNLKLDTQGFYRPRPPKKKPISIKNNRENEDGRQNITFFNVFLKSGFRENQDLSAKTMAWWRLLRFRKKNRVFLGPAFWPGKIALSFKDCVQNAESIETVGQN